MPKFNIAVTWLMSGVYRDVDAATIGEAKEKVMNADENHLPTYPKGKPIDDSFLVDDNETRDMNHLCPKCDHPLVDVMSESQYDAEDKSLEQVSRCPNCNYEE